MNNNEKNKNDKAWDIIFDKFNILDTVNKKGLFEISASDINKYREARLMTKFDHKINLPKLFKQNNLSILPITRGNYVISHFEAYNQFEDIESKPIRVSLPDFIKSIDYENITSESTAINCAFAAGIISDFVNEEYLLPTVSGRMGSGAFDFNIKNIFLNNYIKVFVNNSQIEIDAGFEGKHSLLLLEAKNTMSRDFLIRQLYYPYRLWKENIKKEIIPIFMIYSNGIFTLSQYSFKELHNYNSITLIKQKKYILAHNNISFNDILDIFYKTNIIEEPSIQFPQADTFKRLINLCELLALNNLSRDEITMNYIFAPRQTNYYTDAGRYLGLIEKVTTDGEILFSLTIEAKKIFRSDYKFRQLKLAETILKHKVFYYSFKKYIENRALPCKSDVISIMKDSLLYKVESDSTYQRRAATVMSWLKWLIDLAE